MYIMQIYSLYVETQLLLVFPLSHRPQQPLIYIYIYILIGTDKKKAYNIHKTKHYKTTDVQPIYTASIDILISVGYNRI